jgi:hypothetical protein
LPPGRAGGRVVGAIVVVPRGGEMIHEVVLAIRTRMFRARLALTAHAYPTWSVAIQQAAAQLIVGVPGRRARPVRTHLEPVIDTTFVLSGQSNHVTAKPTVMPFA